MPSGHANLVAPPWLDGLDRANWYRRHKGLTGAAGVAKQEQIHRLLPSELRKLGCKPDRRATLTIWQPVTGEIDGVWSSTHFGVQRPAPPCCFVHNFFGVHASASPAMLVSLLKQFQRAPSLLAEVRVMSWAGMYRFDDECLIELLLLLQKLPLLVSLNMGEKPFLSPTAWLSLVSYISQAQIVCAFVDKIDAGAEIVRLLKGALKARRLDCELEARTLHAHGKDAQQLVPWRMSSVHKKICQPQPGARAHLHLDLAFGKAFWHPKVCWDW